MGAYILRRLLLIIPTLAGDYDHQFTLIQFVPGGPIEQIIAQMEGEGDVFEGISGGGRSDRSQRARPDAAAMSARAACRRSSSRNWKREFGSTSRRWSGSFNMMWNYMRFDFGESYFRPSVCWTLCGKDAGVDHAGALVNVIAYLVSIPLGIARRCATDRI